MKYNYQLLIASTILLLANAFTLNSTMFSEQVNMTIKDPVTGDPRYFLLTLPDNYAEKDNSSKVAVVIYLHGVGETANSSAVSNNLWKRFGSMNVAVAYGMGTETAGTVWLGAGLPPTAWNGGGCCGTRTDVADPTNATDDMGYVKEMMATLVSNYYIDEKRIYLTGWSNGAAMVNRVVCELGDKIRAAVPYAGSNLARSLTRANYMGDNISDTDQVGSLKGAPFFANMSFNWPKASVTEMDWYSDNVTFPNFFSCANGANVPMLIINGYQDKVVDIRGYIISDPEPQPNGKMITAWSPASFNYWVFASLNEKETPTMTTPYSSFTQKPTGYNRNVTVGNTTYNTFCKQIFQPNGSALLTNITWCNGTGGHIWWGAEKFNFMTIEQATTMGISPFSESMDVTDEVYKFFCANGADCKESTPAPAAKKSNTTTFVIVGCVVLVVILIIVGVVCYKTKKNDPDMNEQMMIEQEAV